MASSQGFRSIPFQCHSKGMHQNQPLSHGPPPIPSDSSPMAGPVMMLLQGPGIKGGRGGGRGWDGPTARSPMAGPVMMLL